MNLIKILELNTLGKIISIANQKGGVGKTTTTVNLSACLAQAGKKVLTVDCDPQGNTSSGLGIKKNNLDKTLYNVLLGENTFEEVVLDTCVPNLSILPTNINLSGAEIEMLNIPNREYILEKILQPYRFIYDYILLDCPPSLNILTLNALTCSDSILVPMQCEYYALEGFTQLSHTVDLVKKNLNENLNIEGIVFTMFDSRTNLSMEVVSEVKKYIDVDIYTALIPRNVRLSEAPSYGLPITLYDAKSKGAEAYVLLAEQVMKGGGVPHGRSKKRIR
jgi:chromosome partitioning protein